MGRTRLSSLKHTETCYLFVANFGDRHGGRYTFRSSLWRLDSSVGGSCSEDGSDGSECIELPTGRFTQIDSVDTFGATDCEHFLFEGEHYLAVSEEGDHGRGSDSDFGSRYTNYETVLKSSSK